VSPNPNRKVTNMEGMFDTPLNKPAIKLSIVNWWDREKNLKQKHKIMMMFGSSEFNKYINEIKHVQTWQELARLSNKRKVAELKKGVTPENQEFLNRGTFRSATGNTGSAVPPVLNDENLLGLIASYIYEKKKKKIGGTKRKRSKKNDRKKRSRKKRSKKKRAN